MVHLDQEVVVVYFLTLEGIARTAFDGICVGGSSSGHEVSDASVLVTLVVMNVPGENDETGPGVGRTFLKYLRQALFGGARGVSAAKFLLVRGTRIRRMVEHKKHKVHFSRDVVELAGKPLALRTLDLIQCAVEDQHQRIGRANRVVAAMVEIRKALEIVT